MKSSLRTLTCLLVAAAAFSLGSVGTANAAGRLTRHEVKTISAKVVDQLAPSLSVAHADTAHNADFATNSTNATNANHATSATTADSALATSATRLEVAPVDHVLQKYWLLDVPAGTYFASYDVEAQMSGDTNNLACSIIDAAGQPGQAFQYGYNAVPGFSTASSSAVITVAAGSPTYLYCSVAGGGYLSVAAGSRSSVSLVPIGIEHTGTATGAAR